MLYVFAGFPGKNLPIGTYLNAGGLQYGIEEVEELGLLEHDEAIEYRKEGVFIGTDTKEFDRPIEYVISDMCLNDGITFDWFPENWDFGNGVTCHRTHAYPEYKVVVHGTDSSLEEYLQINGVTKLADIQLENKHICHEGWEEYEARWLSGTCPQENHIVHLTWLLTTHPLPTFAYERIRGIIEDGAELKNVDKYNREAGNHFSTTRIWDGEKAYHHA